MGVGVMVADQAMVKASASFYSIGCKLNRRVVDKWVRVMRIDLPENAKVEFSTRRSITTYEATTVEGLMDALHGSTEPGDVDVLDNLVISVSNFNRDGREGPDRYARIDVRGNSVSCNIHGDPSWVRSQSTALKPLIEEVRPFKWPIWYGPRWTFVLMGISLGSWGALSASLITDATLLRDIAVFLLCVIAGAFVGFAGGSAIARKAKVEVWLERDDFPTSFWRFTAHEVISSVIALLALIATVVFGLVTHGDAQKSKSASLVTSVYGSGE
jgi:hypothetical protein